MNVLWLGDSNDVNERIPDGQRIPDIAARLFTESTGIEIEQHCRVVWPSPDLPDLVSRWLNRYEPEMVIIHTNSYWFTYESVPERVSRVLGPVGPFVAGLGLRAAASPTVSENAVFRGARKLAARTIGGDVAIKAEDCVALMAEVIRRVASHEDATLLVRGTNHPHDSSSTPASYQRGLAACKTVTDGVEEVCNKLHVTHWRRDFLTRGEVQRTAFLGDGVHMADSRHQALGAEEGQRMVEVWRKHTA